MISAALTIAGSDSGGGAGIQADLKTFQELGVFGTSALTAITAQNTIGVHAVQPVDACIVAAQIQAVLTDFPVKAIKTGMLFSAEIIETIPNALMEYPTIPLVIDPVMIAKGGASLLQNEAVVALRNHLLPIATLITPNIPEAEVLTGQTIRSESDMEIAANTLLSMGASAVLLKGGHRDDVPYAEDLFMNANGDYLLLRSKRIETQHTHGTGCTFAAAITAELAKGQSLEEAVVTAKHFIQIAIEDGIEIGHGHGPTNHAAFRRNGRLKTKEVKLIERR
ncbi:bifunctional hydroxymethylpyrimidine kinase/phosphomethylpyrimidine kinase [Sporosarcina sp. BI001-red]|uniref:bifunctional hydroxymethylpyrimidine kinase/phosphomethylpyrimidine kinase n=1 Tax=Sporosarcina sp. BI001-red TaxID=2282866 RepID=UPI000E240F1A|nr:bifunctional hydroxymethylpyrimidine kinase/phosphomethylpyrimidine kinase [Sporosarcina sp. BI001-red]REB07971.1 bifunctional hydroxymethylpyrimidine kinase/phosphomethylpyrimidine kinase [Sporosarcina sp. BI001-red]